MIAFCVLWVAFASVFLVAGIGAESWALVTGRSATEYLPIPIVGAVFVAFGTTGVIAGTKFAERTDGPVLTAWLDAGFAPDRPPRHH